MNQERAQLDEEMTKMKQDLTSLQESLDIEMENVRAGHEMRKEKEEEVRTQTELVRRARTYVRRPIKSCPTKKQVLFSSPFPDTHTIITAYSLQVNSLEARLAENTNNLRQVLRDKRDQDALVRQLQKDLEV